MKASTAPQPRIRSAMAPMFSSSGWPRSTVPAVTSNPLLVSQWVDVQLSSPPDTAPPIKVMFLSCSSRQFMSVATSFRGNALERLYCV